MSNSTEFKLKKEVFEKMIRRNDQVVSLVTKRDRSEGKLAYTTVLSPIISEIAGVKSVAATQSVKIVGDNFSMYFFAKEKGSNIHVEASIGDLRSKDEVAFHVFIGKRRKKCKIQKKFRKNMKV